jgi:putative endonuclease
LQGMEADPPEPPPVPRQGCGGRPPDPRRALGRLGEELAATHLERLGFTILDRNVRSREGEIDLIACDGAALVFVEVKTARTRIRSGDPRDGQRRRDGCAEPLGWLGWPQRARLRRLASAWLVRDGPKYPRAPVIRFDAIGVVLDRSGELVRLDHVEGAW